MANLMQSIAQKFIPCKNRSQNSEHAVIGEHRVKVQNATIDGMLTPVKVRIKSVHSGEKQAKAKLDQDGNTIDISFYPKASEKNPVSVRFTKLQEFITAEQLIAIYHLQKEKGLDESHATVSNPPITVRNMERIMGNMRNIRNAEDLLTASGAAQNNFMRALEQIVQENTHPQSQSSDEIPPVAESSIVFHTDQPLVAGSAGSADRGIADILAAMPDRITYERTSSHEQEVAGTSPEIQPASEEPASEDSLDLPPIIRVPDLNSFSFPSPGSSEPTPRLL